MLPLKERTERSGRERWPKADFRAFWPFEAGGEIRTCPPLVNSLRSGLIRAAGNNLNESPAGYGTQEKRHGYTGGDEKNTEGRTEGVDPGPAR